MKSNKFIMIAMIVIFTLTVVFAAFLTVPAPGVYASESGFGFDDFAALAESVREFERSDEPRIADNTWPPTFRFTARYFFQVGGNAFSDTHVGYYVPPNVTVPTRFRELHMVSITNLRSLSVWFTDDTVTGIDGVAGLDGVRFTNYSDLWGFEHSKRFLRFTFNSFFEMRGYDPEPIRQFILDGNIKSFDKEEYSSGDLHALLFPVMLSDGIAHVTFLQDRGANVFWRASELYINANFDFSIYKQRNQQPAQRTAADANAVTTNALPANAVPTNAIPTSARVFVNGQQIAFEAYNIGGSNYFKLRDIAHVLNGTQKQFDVVWDAAKDAINLLSDTPYSKAGGEMQPGNGMIKNAVPTRSAVLLDGLPKELKAYNIDGNNFFMLRDIGRLLAFSVEWDAAANAIRIDTSRQHTK